MLDYLFQDWRKLSKQSPPQGLDTLIRSLFQNGYDPRNVVNRRVRFLNCVNDMSLRHKKQNVVPKQDIIAENTHILDKNNNWTQLCFLESLYIKRLNPALNVGIKATKELNLFK